MHRGAGASADTPGDCHRSYDIDYDDPETEDNQSRNASLADRSSHRVLDDGASYDHYYPGLGSRNPKQPGRQAVSKLREH